MNRNIFIGFFVVLLILVVSVVYVFNKPHRNVVDAKPQYSLSLDEMHDEFLADEEKAGQKYFDKVVELKGTLSALNMGENGRYNFLLEESVRTASGEIIELNDEELNLVGEEVKIKGLYIGYENLLEEIQLSECTIVKYSFRK